MDGLWIASRNFRKDAGGQSHKIGIGGIIDSNAREIFRIPSSSAFFEISLTELLNIDFDKNNTKKSVNFRPFFETFLW